MFGARNAHDGPLPRVRDKPTTNPILPVAGMEEATAFYRLLGFGVTAYDDDYAWVQHCGWEWLHLRRVESVENNQAGAYLHVHDAEAWRTAMVEASEGAVQLAALADMPWGKREFSFTDPAGNLVRVGSSL